MLSHGCRRHGARLLGARASSSASVFGGLRLSSVQTEGLARLGIEAPLPIQTAAFAPIARGDDVLLHAETGSGKTLAFLLPALCALEGRAPWQLLVMAPTTLLAEQIARVAHELGHAAGDVAVLRVSLAAAAGGRAPRVAALAAGEAAALLGARVVVATPDSMLALARSASWERAVASARAALARVIIDEADAVLAPRAGGDARAAAESGPAPRGGRGGDRGVARRTEARSEAGDGEGDGGDGSWSLPRARKPPSGDDVVRLSRAQRNRALDSSPLVRALRRLTLGGSFREGRAVSRSESSARGRGPRDALPAGAATDDDDDDDDDDAAPARPPMSAPESLPLPPPRRVSLVAVSATASATLEKDLKFALLPPRSPLRVVRAPPPSASSSARAPRSALARALRGVGAVGLPTSLRHHVLLCDTFLKKAAALVAATEALGAADAGADATAGGPTILAVARDDDQAAKLLVALADAPASCRAAALSSLPAAARGGGGGGGVRIAVTAVGETRGLDLPSLRAVALLAPAANVDEYAHVAGRAARVGRVGHALSLLTEAEHAACSGQLSSALCISVKPVSLHRLLAQLREARAE